MSHQENEGTSSGQGNYNINEIKIVEVKSWTEIVHTRSTIRANEEINKRLSEIGELPNIQPQDEVLGKIVAITTGGKLCRVGVVKDWLDHLEVVCLDDGRKLSVEKTDAMSLAGYQLDVPTFSRINLGHFFSQPRIEIIHDTNVIDEGEIDIKWEPLEAPAEDDPEAAIDVDDGEADWPVFVYEIPDEFCLELLDN